MNRWYISRQGQSFGPVTIEQLQKLARDGRLSPQDLVCQEGMKEWQAAGGVAGLFAAAAPLPPIPAAPPIAPSSGPATASAPAGGGWLSTLLSLPKPILFGLCGAIGGLLGALVLGELLWALLRPAAVQAQGPSLLLAVPPSVTVYSGGKNRFTLKIARRGFKGPVRIDVPDAPDQVTVAPVTIADDESDAEVEVRVGSQVPIGVHSMRVQARSRGEGGFAGEGTMDLVIEPLPANLQMTVSPQVTIFQGGKGQFTVKIARSNFNKEVAMRFHDVPAAVHLPPLVIPSGSTEAVVHVDIPRGAPIGSNSVQVEATAALDRERILSKKKSFNLDIQPKPVPKADILFVLDLTASMLFAINGVKDGIRTFVEKLDNQNIDARIGLIAFRDIVDDNEQPYALKFAGETFTKDYRAFAQQVGTLAARGGGDIPESSLQALALAGRQDFRKDAARVLLLITDAPPKFHPQHPPTTVAATVTELEKSKVNQLHLVVQKFDKAAYQPLQNAFPGSFFDITKTTGGNAFAGILPKLSAEISRITIAALPPPPKTDAVPPPPHAESAGDLPPAASVPTMQAVQATQAFAQKDRYHLLAAIAAWTMVMAAGISSLILVGQNLYLRRPWLAMGDVSKATLGGLIAGLVGGAAGQLFFQMTSGSAALEIASRIIGWSLLGALIGLGMAFFLPNLKWQRGLLGGLLGGLMGALAFMLISQFLGQLLGRWTGAMVLGFFIGLMVALAELAFRRSWLEVTFSAREVRTVSLGANPVSVGGDERQAAVFIQGAPPIALRYRLSGDNIICEDVVHGQSFIVEPGDRRRLGSVTVAVCSPASARGIGFALRLSSGKTLRLSEGMPLTADDIPGLEPQGADGAVALISRRPADPKVLLLRNRSRQPWITQDAAGKQQRIDPGLGIELGQVMQIHFGQVQGRLMKISDE